MERFTISVALKVAEEETRKAKLAYEAKEPFAEEHYQECLNTLEGLKIMKERGVPESMKDN